MNRRIVVTGATGQLSRALGDLSDRFASAGFDLARVGRPQFDFDQPSSIFRCLGDLDPALVINAAAWTAVDAAESDPEGARRANDDGPALIAAFCVERAIPLIHVSTDYVFDGLKGQPYVETDPTSPMGAYGATKLAGEQKIAASGARAVILRTSWLYAAEGKNFVRTMLTASAKSNRLRVVADQVGCPTTASDLADAIFAVACRALSNWRPEYGGVFHAAGTGSTTWHGLAVAAFESAARFGNPIPEIAPISTADWPLPAFRPPDSRLDCSLLDAVFGWRMPEWRKSLERTIDRVFTENARR